MVFLVAGLADTASADPGDPKDSNLFGLRAGTVDLTRGAGLRFVAGGAPLGQDLVIGPTALPFGTPEPARGAAGDPREPGPDWLPKEALWTPAIVTALPALLLRSILSDGPGDNDESTMLGDLTAGYYGLRQAQYGLFALMAVRSIDNGNEYIEAAKQVWFRAERVRQSAEQARDEGKLLLAATRERLADENQRDAERLAEVGFALHFGGKINLADSAGRIAYWGAKASAIPMNPAATEMMAAETFGQGLLAWLSDPLRSTRGVLLRSLPHSSLAIAGGVGGFAVAGPKGAAAGAFMGGAVAEFGASAAEGIQTAAAEDGVSLADPEAIVAWVEANPDKVEQIALDAAIRAGIIGAFDATGAGLSGLLVKSVGKGTRPLQVATAGAGVGIESVGGGAGECTAGMVTEGLCAPGEVLAEVIGGGGQGGLTTTGQLVVEEVSTGSVSDGTEAETAATTEAAEEGVEALPSNGRSDRERADMEVPRYTEPEDFELGLDHARTAVGSVGLYGNVPDAVQRLALGDPVFRERYPATVAGLEERNSLNAFDIADAFLEGSGAHSVSIGDTSKRDGRFVATFEPYGFRAINELIAHRLALLGLWHEPATVDNNDSDLWSLTHHDIGHGFQSLTTWKYFFEFGGEYNEVSQGLRPEQRYLFDVAYFLFHHEQMGELSGGRLNRALDTQLERKRKGLKRISDRRALFALVREKWESKTRSLEYADGDIRITVNPSSSNDLGPGRLLSDRDLQAILPPEITSVLETDPEAGSVLAVQFLSDAYSVFLTEMFHHVADELGLPGAPDRQSAPPLAKAAKPAALPDEAESLAQRARSAIPAID